MRACPIISTRTRTYLFIVTFGPKRSVGHLCTTAGVVEYASYYYCWRSVSGNDLSIRSVLHRSCVGACVFDLSVGVGIILDYRTTYCRCRSSNRNCAQHSRIATYIHATHIHIACIIAATALMAIRYCISKCVLVGRSAQVTWADVEWIGTQTSLPLVLKGVGRAEDAVPSIF